MNTDNHQDDRQRDMRGPLAGLKVIEFSVFMAGPVCGLFLADLGADVVKVERIPNGDDSRRMRPPEIGGESAAFMILNRNKRGIAVDAKSADGLQALKTLCRDADIVVENMRPGAMDRLGLGYEVLSADNPGLVYASITGFGRTGPHAERPGLDLIAQAFSGLMSITGEGEGRPPVKVGAPVTDTTAGILAALGIVSAIYARGLTGRGRHLETSLIEAGLTHTYWQAAMALATGETPVPRGSAHPLTAPYEAFKCEDSWIIVGAPNDSLFERLATAVGATELVHDPRFASNELRLRHREDLSAELAKVFAGMTSHDCLERLDAVGVPCGPLHTMPEVLGDPHVRERQAVITVDHATAGEVAALGCPIKFGTPDRPSRKGAPLFGADTRKVLMEAGYSKSELDRLEQLDAIYQGDG